MTGNARANLSPLMVRAVLGVLLLLVPRQTVFADIVVIEDPIPMYVTTVAGSGRTGAADRPSGPPGEAQFYRPEGIAVDALGNIILADTENRLVRRIGLDGSVVTLAGQERLDGFRNGRGTNALFGGPSSVAVDRDGMIYVADSSNHVLRRITPEGDVTTWAGFPLSPGYASGPANESRFNVVAGVAVDADRNVYVADRLNHIVRKITPEREVSVLAGVPQRAGFADGPPGIAFMRTPTAVAVGGGFVYVADTGNNAIRRIAPDGTVRTIGGIHSRFGYRDGPAFESDFNYPRGLAVDLLGNVYVADTANHVVRKIGINNIVTTVAGLLGQPGRYEGTGTSARFNEPRGIALAPDGTLVVADTWSQQVRRMQPGLTGGRFVADPVVALPGAERAVKFFPHAETWEWSWLNRPTNSSAALPPPGATNFTLTPDVTGLYTLRAATTNDAGLVGWRHLDLLAVASFELGPPEFPDEDIVRIPVPGGPGLAGQLEGLFNGQWAFLTNKALPDRISGLDDPLGRTERGRYYRVRFVPAP